MDSYPRAFLTLVSLLSFLVLSFLPLTALGGDAISLNLTFVKPLANGSWVVRIEYHGVTLVRSCTGLLSPNPYYVETKGVSAQLVVAPMYYVIDSVCGDAAAIVEDLAGFQGNMSVAIAAPRGYGVRTALDWRGFGRLGGPYQLPAPLFSKLYVYDSMVVYSRSVFDVYDSRGLSIVYQRGVNTSLAMLAWRVVSCVSRHAGQWLGVSPRSPVVVVLVGRGVHPLYPPGFAFSTAGVVYVKLGGGGLAWLVHTLAHEALHGWLNYDLLGGGFGFEEAAAEFLALRGLRLCNASLYRLALGYHQEMLTAGEDYAAWSELHKRLWEAGLAACNTDIYTATLRRLFLEAVKQGGVRVTLFQFVDAMVENAPPRCRQSLEAMLGPLYPGWTPSFANTTGATVTLVRTVRAASTVTVTKVERITVTVSKTTRSNGGVPGYAYFLLALGSAFAGAAAYAVAVRSLRVQTG